VREVVGQARSQAAQARFDSLLAAAHGRLGPRAAGVVAEGKRLSTHQAVRYALASARPAAAESAASEAGRPVLASGAVNGSSRAAAGSAASSVLTAREWQIADLIARGLSNRGIAEELVISPATAARHVANIMAKLAVSSRAQVAAWTAEQRPAQ
jgi:DNA-binding NarL/FixJ family response regulator